MNREILFRGKRIDNREWVDGCYMTDEQDPTTAYIGHIFGIDDGMLIHDFDVVRVDPETVCRYTGLTDKNGRKIFEGDIVKGVAYSSDFVGAIVWIKEIAGFGVRYFNLHREPTSWENSSILKAIQAGRKDQFAAEVIGNIFDNPELLEGGAK